MPEELKTELGEWLDYQCQWWDGGAAVFMEADAKAAMGERFRELRDTLATLTRERDAARDALRNALVTLITVRDDILRPKRILMSPDIDSIITDAKAALAAETEEQ